MNCPEAVRKHDGRVVAYDPNKVVGALARAALAATPEMAADAARRLGLEIGQAVGSFLAAEGQPVPATADVRSLVIKLLRETGHERIAGAFAEEARAAASLLWGIRVVEPGTPFTSMAGSPWDRRRLLESLRASGIARDPAGDAAREIERRVVALGQERISPALIHALACMVLAKRALDVRIYAARRVAFSLVAQVPRYDVLAAEQCTLPPEGPALEAFWLQSVHSHEVSRTVADNLLSLAPYPAHPADDTFSPCAALAIDPLAPDAQTAWHHQLKREAPHIPALRADGAERLGLVAKWLSHLSAGQGRALSQGIQVFLQLPGDKHSRQLRRASPIAINLAGLLIREALREPVRASVRLAQLAGLAAQAHREREEYFTFSPVRGRVLPVAIAGLWNAAAWLQGGNFDAPQISRASRGMAANFISILRGAVDSVRQQTGMELALAGIAATEATHTFWQKDREFLLRDGISLDAGGAYDGGPSVRVTQRREDLGERLDFARDAGSVFDDPPAVFVEAALGGEPDSELWHELLAALAQSGTVCVRFVPGGGGRSMRNVLKLLRSELGAYPLFDQMELDDDQQKLFGQR